MLKTSLINRYNKTKKEKNMTNQITINLDAFGITEIFQMNVEGEFLSKKLSYAHNDSERFQIVKDNLLKALEKKGSASNKVYLQINPLNGEIVDRGTIEHFKRLGFHKQGIYRCTKGGKVTYNNFVWKEA